MTFNTPLFLFLFLPFFLILYFVADKNLRGLVGLIGSLLFFAWGQPFYVPLMLGIVLLNYLIGQRVGANGQRENSGNRWIFLGIGLDLGMLIFFKILTTYGIGFLLPPGLPLPDRVSLWLKDAPYPLGLSYISFQVIAYLIDVHKGRHPSEKNFLNFSLYVLLFPKILVGPITRYSSLADQLAAPQVSRGEVADGIRRFIAGFAKKALIADTLAKIADTVFGLESPMVLPGIAWLALVSYALQIYFDFSGFTDMAIGLGRMMGFRFIENFNYPYLAQSIGDFWRRWHISLSTWFRDYVFYPLERRRLRFIGQPLNILIVFLLTGLWHGVTLNFVIWGLVHGAAIAAEALFLGRRLQGGLKPVRHVYALGVILSGWVVFRSPTLLFAVQFFKRLFGDTSGIVPLPFMETMPLPIIDPSIWLAVGLGILFSLPLAPAVRKWSTRLGENKPAVVLPMQIAYDLLLLFLFVASIAVTASGNFAPNIYGKF
jgi:alginate O-acetyltransferase complex protein AlgI